MMDIMQAARYRYSTKVFDRKRKIDDKTISDLKEIAQLSASGVNCQPWHFVVASTEEGKRRISASTQGSNSMNEEKIVNASHVFVFCAKTGIDEQYLQQVLEKEQQDGRYANDEIKQAVHGAREFFVNKHAKELGDLEHWMQKQVFLNVGNFLLGAAAMGLDALPMEGFDIEVLDTELNLTEQGLTSVLIVPVGYRDEGDFNLHLPKSRLEQASLFTDI